MAKVLLENLTKHFDEVVAVKDLDLEISDREFAVLVGPSGCGKSTILRMIAGLEEATSGNIFIDGIRVNSLPPKDRDVAMVFQNYALYPHMTVYDNMAFSLKLRRFAPEEIRRRVLDAAAMLNIGELLTRKPKALSGGQQQRVAVGRAIVRQPKAFLFDEPLSNLDAKLRVQMRIELKKLHERLQTTMIYVTHDQVEAMTLGDRIVVMKDGWKQQVGPPLHLYFHPANKFVAGFIGSPGMNFVKAELISRGGTLFLQSAGFNLKVPEEKARKLEGYDQKQVIFGIRPEDLPESSQAIAGETFDALVEVVEPIGSEVYLNVKAGEDSFTARAASNTRAKPHREVCLKPRMDHLHLFDVGDERALL